LFKLRFEPQFFFFFQAEAKCAAAVRAGLFGGHARTVSGGKSGAAFLTAASDDITTTGSGHTGEETEPAFATAVRGLKSSFHFRFILFFDYLPLKNTLPRMAASEDIIPQL
jgi:hypothetical protein